MTAFLVLPKSASASDIERVRVLVTVVTNTLTICAGMSRVIARQQAFADVSHTAASLPTAGVYTVIRNSWLMFPETILTFPVALLYIRYRIWNVKEMQS